MWFAGMTEVSNIRTVTPRSQSFAARTFAAFSVWPYTDAYASMTLFSSGA